MWHPKAHVGFERDEEGGFTVWHHLVDGEVQKLKSQPRKASDYVDLSKLALAGISGYSCTRGGPAERGGWATHLVHLCRDTDYGCVVRSRLFFGDFDPAPPAPVRSVLLRLFDEDRARWTMSHTSEEYVYLSQFLPALYAREAA
jgi:hypothetical protein